MGQKLSEFELIARIARLGAPDGAQIIKSIGDDAAIVRPSKNCDLVWAADAQVEDVHFRRRWAAPQEIGWRALAVNLSDLAAMGARPLGALASIAVPGAWSDADVLDLHRGIARCGRHFGCPLIGGNISSSPGKALQVHVSVLGETRQGRALTRSSAREGDDVWVSGEVGGAALALASLEKAKKLAPAGALRRYLQPKPPLAFAAELASLKVRAAIDVSDGLWADLGHVLEASRSRGARIELARVPVPRALAELRTARKWRAFAEKLGGGEDYEILFTTEPSERTRAQVTALAKKHRTRATRIGTVTRTPGIALLTGGGDVLRYDGPRGWQHRR